MSIITESVCADGLPADVDLNPTHACITRRAHVERPDTGHPPRATPGEAEQGLLGLPVLPPHSEHVSSLLFFQRHMLCVFALL